MSASILARLRRLEQEAAAKNLPPVVVISGTDEEHDAKVAEAYATGLATPDQLLVYIRKPCGPAEASCA